MNFLLSPGGAVNGDIRVPGDKSMSHRSIMLGSIATGTTHVEGFLEGEDALATLNAFKAMGVDIEGPDQGRVVIKGVGLHGLKAPQGELYMGNSGTTIRLMSGLMAGQAFDVTMIGDESLNKRPMGRVATPLSQMGVQVQTADAGRPPLTIKGGQPKAIHYDLPMASAQVKSCVLLAGLYAEGETSVTEPAPTRDHTERMLQGFGCQVEVDGDTVRLQGGQTLKGCDIDVPADISSAAFYMVAASIAPDSEITLRHVGVNPTRTGIIDILKLMGGDITVFNHRSVGGEPVADICVRSAKLKGIDIPEHLVPLAIDEFPVLFIAAACAEGTTRLTGAEELRVKESDRIQAMADGLIPMGVDAQPTDDGIVINGSPMGESVELVEVDACHDHRIAMAFAIASLRAKCQIKVIGCDNVATSFPTFASLATQVGINLRVENV